MVNGDDPRHRVRKDLQRPPLPVAFFSVKNILFQRGWIRVAGHGLSCAKCQMPIQGMAVLHPLTFQHFHAKCALQVGDLQQAQFTCARYKRHSRG
jgi:hypothetical protein